jgi:phosphoglycolate phosphatase-like HAD superfamily hydrolase
MTASLPSPEGIIEAARIMDVPVAEVLSVGDFVFDVEVAVNAGCQSAFLTNGKGPPRVRPDFLIETLDEIIGMIHGASR